MLRRGGGSRDMPPSKRTTPHVTKGGGSRDMPPSKRTTAHATRMGGPGTCHPVRGRPLMLRRGGGSRDMPPSKRTPPGKKTTRHATMGVKGHATQ